MDAETRERIRALRGFSAVPSVVGATDPNNTMTQKTISALRQPRASTLPGYGQPSVPGEFLSGFVGGPRRFSVMDPEAQDLQRARDIGEQASVAVELYGAATPFAAASTLARGGQMAGVSQVIKPKGGNWFPGQVERATQRLKYPLLEDNRFYGMNLDQVSEYMDATEEEVLRLTSPSTLAINKWIDTKLTKYIKNEMGTPEDPVRALAERGILHQELRPNIEGTFARDRRMRLRTEFGMPAEPQGKSELAQFWENLADRAIEGGNAARYKYGALQEEFSTLEHPFLKYVPDETKIYIANVGRNLGFNHLLDELRNAMNPNSGLPRNLQITPDKLEKVSMPQAVELVSKINKWRADNLKRMQLEQTLTADSFKQYPETGYRWVQLNRPGQFAAESDAMGHSVRGYEPPEGGGDPLYGIGGFKAIQSGKAKVYSLRDKKGQPHVTIEVMEIEGQRPIIRQIKGKSNAKPSEEYLPFVQDFVQSGSWSEVRDFRNIGLESFVDAAGVRHPGRPRM